jgi:hypothetical protein
MRPEFLPGAGDWKATRHVLPCNAWLVPILVVRRESRFNAKDEFDQVDDVVYPEKRPIEKRVPNRCEP